MAHFARIDENNIVQEVLVVDNSQEHRGQDFLANDLGLGGRWIQTSYNNNFRKQYAGIGYTYDETKDIFVSPQPFPSWTLDAISLLGKNRSIEGAATQMDTFAKSISDAIYGVGLLITSLRSIMIR